MQNAKWLAGAFSAYGLARVEGARKRVRVSLMTSGDIGYVELFHELAGIGRVEPFKNRWHWTCDDPEEIKAFHLAVGAHLYEAKLKMIESTWESWRRRFVEMNEDLDIDPGPIDGAPRGPESA